jgi:hypothetical protein
MGGFLIDLESEALRVLILTELGQAKSAGSSRGGF